MKKIYLSALTVSALSFLSIGQYNNDDMMRAKTKTEPAKGVNIQTTKAPGDVIDGASYDFETPANWTIDNSGVTGTGWVIGTDGPAGFFSGGMGAINSTSGGNFALFDADGAPGSGTITMANPIDCSGQTNVAFEFESYYRNFQGSAFFEISVDGTTWTPFQVHASLPSNESTDNPQLVSVNVSAEAAGQATVWARFRYESADDYAWMIDDVRFVEGFDDELILEDLFMSAGVEELDYYQIPTDQLQSFTYGARLSNGGVNDQTNTSLNVKVNDGTTDIYDESSTLETIVAYSNDSLGVTTDFTAPGEGEYVTRFDLSSADATDQQPDNNKDTLAPITVGGNVYARDNGIVTGSTGYFGTTPVETIMGQYYEFPSEFVVGEVEVGISAGSAAGEEVFVELRVLNDAGDEFVVQAGSDPYTLEDGDLGSYIRIPLTEDFVIQPGDIVEVLAGHFGSADVRIVNAQVGFGAIVYNDGARTAQNSLFHVRPVRSSVGLEEKQSKNNLLGVNVYPNPVENNFKLSYNLTTSSDIEVEIRDVTGKIVYTLNESKSQGNHLVELDASTFNSGVYFAVVKSDKNIAQRKFIVK